MKEEETTTPDWISEIKKRLEAATPGPWYVSKDQDRGFYIDCQLPLPIIDAIGNTSKENAEFIAHAPTDMKLLLDEMEAASKCPIEGCECRTSTVWHARILLLSKALRVALKELDTAGLRNAVSSIETILLGEKK